MEYFSCCDKLINEIIFKEGNQFFGGVMIVAVTGITGNMGQATLDEIVKLNEIDKFKFLVLEDDKRIKKLLKKHKDSKAKFEIIYGNLKDFETCQKLVQDCDYVVNLAAVIPPHSDKFPLKAIECNEKGVKNLIKAIEGLKKQPKYIHISTVALYGNRNFKHPWGRVGDPLLVSPFDIYSATKLRGEFAVLESNIKNWAVIRQTAMLHNNMLADNLNDGLMFHTAFNSPLEWATAEDSGLLIANILKSDIKKDLGDKFWKKVFNLGGGAINCLTGYDTLNDGFKLIGGSAKDFFKPNYNATRNFHGMWFSDGKVLDEMFHYQRQTVDEFWQKILKNHSYYKMGKIVPKSLISTFAIKRLFKDDNSPKYWLKHNDEAKMLAYFGGKEKYDEIGEDWSKFPLLVENRCDDGKIDYAKLRNVKNAVLIDYHIDINKEKYSLADLQNYAKEHGGKLLSKEFSGDLYQKLDWETQDGEKFSATPFTVIKAGHWFNPIYKENVWDFDRLAKKDKVFGEIWYDSHDENENNKYFYDEEFNAHYLKIKD